MAYVTGEIVSSGNSWLPFKIVFKRDDAVVAEWLVKSKNVAERQIERGLKRLAQEMREGDDEFDESN